MNKESLFSKCISYQCFEPKIQMNDIRRFKSNSSTYIRAISLTLTRPLRWWTSWRLLAQDLHPISDRSQHYNKYVQFIALICLHSSTPNKCIIHYNSDVLRSSCTKTKFIWIRTSENIQHLTWFLKCVELKPPRLSASCSFVLPLLNSAITEPSN